MANVYFIQYQREKADFSDGVADSFLYRSLEEAEAAFRDAGGHRRLLTVPADAEINAQVQELKRV